MNDILQKLEKPLKLETKNGCLNNAVIDGFDKFVLSLAQEGIIKDVTHKVLFSELYNLFKDYKDKNTFERQKCLNSAITIINQIKESSINYLLFELNSPVQYLKGVGPVKAKFLKILGINTIADLLQYYPRDYCDYTKIKPIAKCVTLNKETICGTVIDVKIIKPYRFSYNAILKVIVRDKTGFASLVFFNQQKLFPYLQKIFTTNTEVIVTGKFIYRYNEIQTSSFDYEIIDKDEEKFLLQTGRIVPIYRLSETAKNIRQLRKIIKSVIDKYVNFLIEILPLNIIHKYNFPLINEAIKNIHYPSNFSSLQKAKQRIIFEEFFFLQLSLALKKRNVQEEKKEPFKITNKLLPKFYNDLKFELTNAQKRVIAEIQNDMCKNTPMNRLLQGDVGSGKTIVAIASMLFACENGYQSAIMAPTEILAEQHYFNICKILSNLNIKITLLVSNMKQKEKKEVLEKIKNGEADIIVGTHALIQEKVSFNKLCLVIIDEQHRFGVMQRQELKQKGLHTNVLVMTATPIPRTLCLTVYGDLEISVIDEMPKQRGKIITNWCYEREREKIYNFIKNQIKLNHQVYIVYPLVEESEKLDLKAATEMKEHLEKCIFPDLKIGLVHGKMKREDKEKIMTEFKQNKINILVATTVIEVGIDISNVTVMVIEHSERFGLAQLHQLRGRIGRGEFTSYCILFVSKNTSQEAKQRIEVFTKTINGFEIAEEDLKQRGPGEFLGTRQHGLPEFKLANIIRDSKILELARKEAFNLISNDPNLLESKHKFIKKKLFLEYKNKIDLITVG